MSFVFYTEAPRASYNLPQLTLTVCVWLHQNISDSIVLKGFGSNNNFCLGELYFTGKTEILPHKQTYEFLGIAAVFLGP